MCKKTVNIVVSKYVKNIDWTRKLIYPVTIYDKSPGGNLPNIGRETHTYLYHIIENYDNLPDIIIFLQDAPFDHVRGTDLISYINDINIYKDEKFLWFPNSYIYNQDSDIDPRAVTRENRKKLSEYIGIPFEEKYEFCGGAQFIVSKELILNKTKDFYQKCMETFDIFKDDSNLQGAPWIIERLWTQIFKDYKNI